MGPEAKTGFLHLLGLAKRAGRTELGEDGVSGAAADGKARVVFLAADAAENSIRRARNATRELRHAGHYRIRPGRLGSAKTRGMLSGHLR